MARRYSSEEQQKFVSRYQNGQSTRSICEGNDISKSTLYYWIHKYGEIKTAKGKTVTAQRLYLLEKRIRRLTVENEIWRQCKCTIDSPIYRPLLMESHLIFYRK